MGILILSPFTGVGLYKTRIVEVVHPVERICRDKDNTGIGVNLTLRISKFNGLQNCVQKTRISKDDSCKWIFPPKVPAGSFKCDKLVKSSEASRTGGFINGGRSLSSAFPSSTISDVVLAIFYSRVYFISSPSCLFRCLFIIRKSAAENVSYLSSSIP